MHRSIYLSIYQSIYLSIYLCIYHSLSIYKYIYSTYDMLFMYVCFPYVRLVGPTSKIYTELAVPREL